MLQSVDWGAVAFGIVLVELDGKNATKDTGVRHLLAAQGHVYQLVKVAPVPCQHSDPMPLHTHPKRPRICCLLAHVPRSPSSPGASGVTSHPKAPSKYCLTTVNTGVRWEHRRLLPRRDLAQRTPRQTSHAKNGCASATQGPEAWGGQRLTLFLSRSPKGDRRAPRAPDGLQ